MPNSKKAARKIIQIDPEAKIVPIKGAEIPFREGSGARKRVETVLRAKQVKAALSRGARLSTVRTCVKLKLIRVAA